jgi:hypothetical protein
VAPVLVRGEDFVPDAHDGDASAAGIGDLAGGEQVVATDS